MSHIRVLLRCSVVVFHHDRVLLVHRRDKDDWALPGGTPRPGEDLLACARRELHEETGILVDPGVCAFIVETRRPYSTRLVDLVFLSPPGSAPEGGHTEEGLNPVFVPLDEIGVLNLHPDIAPNLRDLHHRREGPVQAQHLHREWHDTRATRP